MLFLLHLNFATLKYRILFSHFYVFSVLLDREYAQLNFRGYWNFYASENNRREVM